MKMTKQRHPMLEIFIKGMIILLLITTLSSCSEDETDPCVLGDCENCATLQCELESPCANGGCPNYQTYFYEESEVTIRKDLRYGVDRALTYDYYEVQKNPDETRPLVIVSPSASRAGFGGLNALNGLCLDLARRGYLVALIYSRNVRTGNTLKDDLTFWISFVHDQKAAVRYFKKEAESLRVDKENIFLAGYGAGAVGALMTAHMDLTDLQETSVGKDEFLEVYEEIGLEGLENTGESSAVQGVVMMTVFTNDVNYIDSDGPAMMIIHNKHAVLANGTQMMGAYEYNNGTYSIELQGPDLMREHALTEGYVEGDNLGYILMDEWLPSSDYDPILSTLTSDNWGDIAAFFKQNSK